MGLCIGKISPPKPKDGEMENDFASRLENWDSVHCPGLSTL